MFLVCTIAMQNRSRKAEAFAACSISLLASGEIFSNTQSTCNVPPVG